MDLFMVFRRKDLAELIKPKKKVNKKVLIVMNDRQLTILWIKIPKPISTENLRKKPFYPNI